MTLTLLHDVRPWGGAPADVLVDADGIREIAAPGTIDPAITTADAVTIDGDGGILIPSFSDVHVHLDSTRMGLSLIHI